MALSAAVGLALDDADRKQSIAIRQHRSAPPGMVLRINITLGAAEGPANRVLAGKLSTTVPTVLLWRKRCESDGIRGFSKIGLRSGRPQTDLGEPEAAIDGTGFGVSKYERWFKMGRQESEHGAGASRTPSCRRALFDSLDHDRLIVIPDNFNPGARAAHVQITDAEISGLLQRPVKASCKEDRDSRRSPSPRD
jgi:hypothetical protein